MLREFINRHRKELLARAREMEVIRGRSTPVDPEHGAAEFLTQLEDVLRDSSFGGSAMAATARQHGGEMLKTGLSIAEVVHDYADICESLTDLAVDQGSAITNEELRTLHRCLDEAIAAAVTEFIRLRELLIARDETERVAVLAHEQRNLLSVALVAYQMLGNGKAKIGDRTGAALGRALIGLQEIINRSMAAARVAAGMQYRARVAVSEFIADMEDSARLEAAAKGLHFIVAEPPQGVGMLVDRMVLASAVTNLLTNAFKFTRSSGCVVLRTAASEGRIHIEVEDECGGLPAGYVKDLFSPFTRRSTDRTGLGLGLAISQRGVQANGGTLDVRNLPGKGCVFSIHLPTTA